jgi:exonuclease III
MPTILTLNLRHGGGRRATLLGEYLVGAGVDVLVLTEWRENAAGRQIAARLRDAGYGHLASSQPPPRTNGVAIAARTAIATFETRPHPDAPLPAAVGGQERRWLECDLGNFRVVGSYFPGRVPKVAYWSWFLPRAVERVDTPCVLAGDYNTGKHHVDEAGATFHGAKYLEDMERAAWTDAWRACHPVDDPGGRDFTWWSPRGNGFRVDHVWLSPALAIGPRGARHDHTPRTRGATDHAAVIVDVDAAGASDIRYHGADDAAHNA